MACFGLLGGGQVSASAGSACHTGGGVSAVLEAIDVPRAFIKGTLRLSVGRHTTTTDVDRAAQIIGLCAVKWASLSQQRAQPQRSLSSVYL